jgi:ectoine hydroxylase-related dioxygenase (phytanoyl-CoA dioxygenase family)
VELAADEGVRFARDGFAGPFTYVGAQAMAAVRGEIERRVFGGRGPAPRDRFESRHQDCKVLYDICAAEPLVGRVASVLGPDLLVWNSVLFCKEPGGREVPWHQDLDFLLLDPHVNVSVWLAIDPSTRKNGCLQVIPGSHATQVPHRHRQKRNQFMAHAEPAYVDKSRAVDVELEPGQFILFHRDLLHHSGPNLSIERRMGLTVRYTVPEVKVMTRGLFPGHRVYCVRGQDSGRINVAGEPPAS